MIKLAKIEVVWSESRHLRDNTTYQNISELDRAVMTAAIFAPKDGSYDKTKFRLTFEDGLEWEGRLDIQHPIVSVFRGIKNHIEETITYLSKIDLVLAAEGINFLDQYSLGGDTCHETQAFQNIA